MHNGKNRFRSQFLTKVVVNDECISVNGEGAPNVVGFFRDGSIDVSPMNCYDCDLSDLPLVLLQQVFIYHPMTSESAFSFFSFFKYLLKFLHGKHDLKLNLHKLI